MLRFIRKIVIGVSLILLCGVLVINIGIAHPFSYLYQDSISRQYDAMKKLKNESKMVLIGPSSFSFGTNIDTLEQLSGRKCQFLGGHYGYGTVYFLEMSKPYLKEGDTVIIEYANFEKDFFGADLLLTGIDNKLEMFRFVKPYMWKAAIQGYPDYVSRKVKRLFLPDPANTGIYSADTFDENGNCKEWYTQCLLSDPYDGEKGMAEYPTGDLDKGTIDRLNEYTEYCKKKGVTVFITVPPVFDEAVETEESVIAEHDRLLKEKLTAEYISDSQNYIFPREYISDGVSHMTGTGAVYRTEKLWEDIKRAENK